MLPHLSDYLTRQGWQREDFPVAVHAPGRINLIGEHTDYTGGLVMPASIDKGIEFYARPAPGDTMDFRAVDLGKTASISLPVVQKTGELWVDYLAGIIGQFQLLGFRVPPLTVVFGGNVPRGSGMSSSAALEGGMAFLLNEWLGAKLSRPELAQLCQRSSNNFIGIPSGIMDQFASLNGSAAGPIMLNCHQLSFTPIDANLPGYSWLLVNSMVTHELASSEYPVRVRQCATALASIRQRFPDVADLSAATKEQLAAVADQMDAVSARRAGYVINENERVRQMAKALGSGDAVAAGTLLNATHAGLRDDYEVSCPEVDFLQSVATQRLGDWVAGARIMGGGFGGCTINLVKTAGLAKVQQMLTAAYRAEFDVTPEFYPVTIGPGARLI